MDLIKRYAIIPIEKTTTYISENTTYCKKSLDEQYIIWDKNWDAEIYAMLQQDPTVTLLTHEEALAEMQKETWQTPE